MTESKLSRRGLLAAAAGALVGCAHGATPTGTPEAPLKALLLIHGAGTGSWLWEGVVASLRKRGYAPLAPSLTGAGERATSAGASVDLSTHVDEIARLLTEADLKDVVMVGFGYGGMVIGNVAQVVPERVGRLIYVDAFVPVPGQSMFDLMPPPVRAAMEAEAAGKGQGWQVPPAPIQTLGGVGAISGNRQAEVLGKLERRRPWPIATYAEPARAANPAAAPIPRDYILCAGKQGPDPLRRFADQARTEHWGYAELPTGHFAPLTMPEELAALIATAAEGKLGDR
jgi:pimeloyl-ACP methyl ester carboxylesterase